MVLLSKVQAHLEGGRCGWRTEVRLVFQFGESNRTTEKERHRRGYGRRFRGCRWHEEVEGKARSDKEDSELIADMVGLLALKRTNCRGEWYLCKRVVKLYTSTVPGN